MKNLLKITAVSSLLIIACLLISACGGSTERAARNEGEVRYTVKDSGNLPLAGVTVQVREVAGTGTLTNLGTTDTDGHLTYTGTAGHVYYFTFSKAGYTTQTDIESPELLWSDRAERDVILL